VAFVAATPYRPNTRIPNGDRSADKPITADQLDSYVEPETPAPTTSQSSPMATALKDLEGEASLIAIHAYTIVGYYNDFGMMEASDELTVIFHRHGDEKWKPHPVLELTAKDSGPIRDYNYSGTVYIDLVSGEVDYRAGMTSPLDLLNRDMTVNGASIPPSRREPIIVRAQPGPKSVPIISQYELRCVETSVGRAEESTSVLAAMLRRVESLRMNLSHPTNTHFMNERNKESDGLFLLAVERMLGAVLARVKDSPIGRD